MGKQPKLKTYQISGYVEVAVTATFQAKNLREAKRIFKETEEKYGRGNGTSWNYEEGPWVSEVYFDEPITEVKEGT